MTYENFDKLIDYFGKLQDADLFPIIAVSGPLGTGKSSFSIQASIKQLKKKFNTDYFSCLKYIAYDNPEVMEKYYSLEENSPLIADEAARFAMGEDWNKAINKELKKTTAQLRPRHLLFFMNIPNFLWLDGKYRGEMVSMWVWIPTRGYAVIFQPDNNPGESDRWHLNDFKKWKQIITPFTDPRRIHDLVSKHKCFFDMVQFPKVPEDIYEAYFELRQKKTYTENAGNYVDQKDMAKIMIYNLKHKWDEFTNAVDISRFKKPTNRLIADKLMIDPYSKNQVLKYVTISNWDNEIVRKLDPKELTGNADNKTDEGNEERAGTTDESPAQEGSQE